MDTALPQKFPFILDRNLAQANCTRNRVCTSCDIVALGINIKNSVDIPLHRKVSKEKKLKVSKMMGKTCILLL